MFTATVNETELSRYYVHFRKNTMCKNVGFGASDILVGYYYTYKEYMGGFSTVCTIFSWNIII